MYSFFVSVSARAIQKIDKIMNPRDSAAFICEHAKDVTINESQVEHMSADVLKMLKAETAYLRHKSWKLHPLNPKTADESSISWIFLVDALNFSFWTAKECVKYEVKYGDSVHTGYWSLCAAVNRALDEGVPVLSARFLAGLTEETAAKIFRSDSETSIPLLKERVAVMNEIGSILLSEFDGSFSNCIIQANGNAQNLLRRVIDNFPCFRDEAVYMNRRVSIYKRAQILIADVWACFEGEGLGAFDDIDTITMFADYRIPQILVYFGVVHYSDRLQSLLDDEHLFSNGDAMEVEIRGASIHAVELLSKAVNKKLATDDKLKGKTVNAILLDHFLWDYRRAHDKETKHIPFHKVRCIYY